MFEQFTLGIEEEFQIVDPHTRELRSHGRLTSALAVMEASFAAAALLHEIRPWSYLGIAGALSRARERYPRPKEGTRAVLLDWLWAAMLATLVVVSVFLDHAEAERRSWPAWALALGGPRQALRDWLREFATGFTDHPGARPVIAIEGEGDHAARAPHRGTLPSGGR